jgi:hypothetical protein
VGSELLGMAPEESRASFDLCARLLGISWVNDEDDADPLAGGDAPAQQGPPAAPPDAAALDALYESVKRCAPLRPRAGALPLCPAPQAQP